MPYTIKEISENLKKNNLNISINNKYLDLVIYNTSTLKNSKNNDITFFHNSKYLNDLKYTKASFCFIEKKYDANLSNNCIPIITNEPYKAFILTVLLFNPKRKSNGKISKLS